MGVCLSIPADFIPRYEDRKLTLRQRKKLIKKGILSTLKHKPVKNERLAAVSLSPNNCVKEDV